MHSIFTGITVCPGMAASLRDCGKEVFPKIAFFFGDDDAERFGLDIILEGRENFGDPRVGQGHDIGIHDERARVAVVAKARGEEHGVGVAVHVLACELKIRDLAVVLVHADKALEYCIDRFL